MRAFPMIVRLSAKTIGTIGASQNGHRNNEPNGTDAAYAPYAR
jgi:hypothetical protein